MCLKKKGGGGVEGIKGEAGKITYKKTKVVMERKKR